MLKIEPSSTLEYSFLDNSKLVPFVTRFVEATPVRVSTSVKMEKHASDHSGEWVLADHTSINWFKGHFDRVKGTLHSISANTSKEGIKWVTVLINILWIFSNVARTFYNNWGFSWKIGHGNCTGKRLALVHYYSWYCRSNCGVAWLMIINRYWKKSRLPESATKFEIMFHTNCQKFSTILANKVVQKLKFSKNDNNIKLSSM